MSFEKIGFIGAGRIVRVILEGLNNRNFKLEKISAYDCNMEVLNNISARFPSVKITDAVEKVCNTDLIILAIHPPVVMETLEKIKSCLSDKNIILSLAPKIKISQIKEKLGGFGRIARCNPNLTSIINKGYNPICFSDELNDNERERIISLFDMIGKTAIIKEETLEVYAVISAMLPTYFWFMWDELLKLGEQFGLDDNETKNILKEVIPPALDIFLMYRMEAYNLIPARPLKDEEEKIREIIRTKITETYRNLRN